MTTRAYRVWRKADRDDCYYLLAASPREAIEIVTMHLADLEGHAAWSADADAPSFSLARGKVVDAAGKDVPSVSI